MKKYQVTQLITLYWLVEAADEDEAIKQVQPILDQPEFLNTINLLKSHIREVHIHKILIAEEY